MEEDDTMYSQEDEELKREKKKKKKKKAKRRSDAIEYETGDNFQTEEEVMLEGDEDLGESVDTPTKKKKKKKKKKLAREEVDSDFEKEPSPIPSTSKAASQQKAKIKLPPVKVTSENSKKDLLPSSSTKASEVNKISNGKSSGKRKQKKAEASDEATETDKVALVDDPEAFNGMNILTQMSQDDIEELLNQIGKQCPPNDTKRDKVRERQIDWRKVAFSNYGPVQCKSVWTYIRNQARNYRIVHEIVDEIKLNFQTDYTRFMKKVVESTPEFPKQPYAASGFHLYCRQLWDKHKEIQIKMNAKVENFIQFQTKCYQDYQNLPDSIKEEYNDTAKTYQAAYKKQIKDFYTKYPGFAKREKLNKEGKTEPAITSNYKRQALIISKELHGDAPKLPLNPLQLFVNSKLNHLDPPPTFDEMSNLKAHYVEKWKRLSDSKKLKWIESCIKKSEKYLIEVREYKKTHPLYLLPKEFNIGKLITKEEFKLWGEAHGQPPKPRLLLYDIFMDDFRQSEEAVGTEDEIRALAEVKWQNLDWYHKEMYKMKNRMDKVTFKKKFEEYYLNVPVLLRGLAMSYMPKLLQKSFLEEVEKDPLVMLEEEPTLVRNDTGGKRKRDEGTAGESNPEDSTKRGSPSKKKKKKETMESLVEENEKTGSIPLYMQELTDEHKKLIDEKVQEEKRAFQSGKKQSKQNKETKAVDVTKDFLPGKKINQNMITEAIRGIFDGLQLRNFSIYYFYAKYVVSKSGKWWSLYRTCGIVKTALTVIETFHRLNDKDKEQFYEEAMNFHSTHRKYGSILTKADLHAPRLTYFPQEPKPPPKSAALLYYLECRLKKTRKKSERKKSWHKQSERTQMLYLKKLYKLNKEYVVKFEKFVKHMTPSDLAAYVQHRCQEWEQKRQMKPFQQNIIKLRTAAKPLFASETFRAELSDDGQESEPEIYEVNKSVASFPHIRGRESVRYENNPFTKKKQLEKYERVRDTQEKSYTRRKIDRRISIPFRNKMIEAIKTNTDDKPREQYDSDIPSSDEDNMLYDKKDKLCLLMSGERNVVKAREFMKEIRELQRYYYPLNDLYEFNAINPPQLPEQWWRTYRGKNLALQCMEFHSKKVKLEQEELELLKKRRYVAARTRQLALKNQSSKKTDTLVRGKKPNSSTKVGILSRQANKQLKKAKKILRRKAPNKKRKSSKNKVEKPKTRKKPEPKPKPLRKPKISQPIDRSIYLSKQKLKAALRNVPFPIVEVDKPKKKTFLSTRRPDILDMEELAQMLRNKNEEDMRRNNYAIGDSGNPNPMPSELVNDEPEKEMSPRPEEEIIRLPSLMLVTCSPSKPSNESKITKSDVNYNNSNPFNNEYEDFRRFGEEDSISPELFQATDAPDPVDEREEDRYIARYRDNRFYTED